MKRNPLRFLGLLGLLGLTGLFTGNPGLFGFFGFFALFGFNEKVDEMLHRNLGRAAFKAFIVSSAGLILGMVSLYFIEPGETAALVAAILFGVIFAAQFLTFVLSYRYYERKGEH